MYWTDDNSNRLYRANLDGSNAAAIVNSDLSCPGRYSMHRIATALSIS